MENTERKPVDVLTSMGIVHSALNDAFALVKAIQDDASELAIDAGLDAREWPAFVPKRTAAALAKMGGAQ